MSAAYIDQVDTALTDGMEALCTTLGHTAMTFGLTVEDVRDRLEHLGHQDVADAWMDWNEANR